MNRRFLALALFCSASAHAGIVIVGTRFVFPEKADSITVDMNNTADSDYLVQTRISPFNGKQLFIATPPLMPIGGGHAGKIRIIRAGGGLPADRESLFYLTIAAIPSGKPEANSLQIAVKSRMKLFYRPAGLKEAETAWQKLKWKRSGGVEVSNLTPYYVTLSELSFNGQPVATPPMLAPFSQATVAGCVTKAPCQIQWQSLNEYGQETAPAKLNLR